MPTIETERMILPPVYLTQPVCTVSYFDVPNHFSMI